MGRSANRRTVEIPAAVYDLLAAEAEREGTTISAHLQALIIDGRDHREWYGRIESALWEVRRSVDRLTARPAEVPGGGVEPPTRSASRSRSAAELARR